MDPIAADDGEHDGAAFVPSDNTTLTSVLGGLESEGFTAHLSAVPGGRLRCDRCGEVSDAAHFRVASIRRLEGASEPGEMMSVVAAVCPRCSGRGVAVLGYGPAALVRQPELRHELGARAAWRAHRRFAWPVVARSIVEAYRRVCVGRPGQECRA